MESFWDHLEVLRGVIIRSLAVVTVAGVALFCLKDALFAILFAPAEADFITYRLLHAPQFHASFINTELTDQFMVHLEVAGLAGLVVAMPYIIVELYRFIAPGLYRGERRITVALAIAGTALFAAGVALNYFVIFPFAFRFLAEYQVADRVVNQIALRSYVSTLLMLSLVIGLMFEMPIVAWFLGRLGLVDRHMLGRYRRHAFVGLAVLAAVITPTGDIFTLLLVTLPLYGLYELSILVVRRCKT